MLDYELGVRVLVVLMLRAGQILLTSGAVRSKNAADAGVRGLLDLAVLLLAAWAVAGAVLPLNTVDRPVFAVRNLLGNGNGTFTLLTILPALVLGSGAVLGATGERVRKTPVLVFAAVFATALLPLVVRFVGTGGLPRGFYPPTAVGVLGGGAAALAMTLAAGARKGKFNRDLSVNYVPGHSVVFQTSGLLLVAAAWCAVMPNAVHGVLAFAAALLAGAAFGRFKFGKIDVGLLLAAGVGGLAAAAMGGADSADRLGAGGASAVIAGGISGIAVPWAVMLLETRWRVDDVTGVSASYLVGGTVGLVVAAFTHPPVEGGFGRAVLADVLIWVLPIVVCGGVAYAVAKAADAKKRLRVSESTEYDGLDLADLDINAYPDFQQTMIKSHHLRQL